MTTYRVVYSPEAEDQLAALYRYIAKHASPATAKRFTDEIFAFCESLDHMPRRGKPRGDLRPGLRILSFRRRVVVAYAVEPGIVTILGVFYRGQDWETLLSEA